MVEINLEDPVVKSYLFYVCVLVAKTMFMTLLTALARSRKKVLISPEDIFLLSCVLGRKGEVKYDDPDVERVRRAHLNDLENIPQFIFAGFVYVLTKPDPLLAVNLFRIFTLFRYLHTFVYAILPIPQPARVICFSISYAIAYYMVLCGVLTFFKI